MVFSLNFFGKLLVVFHSLILNCAFANSLIPKSQSDIRLSELRDLYDNYCWDNNNTMMKPELKKKFRLERHPYKYQHEHGDVCRDPSKGKTSAMYCPRGCRPIKQAPYCVYKELGSVSTTCRIDLSVPGGIEGMSLKGNKMHALRAEFDDPLSSIDTDELILAGSRILVKKLPLSVTHQDAVDIFSAVAPVKKVNLKWGQSSWKKSNDATAVATVTFYKDEDGSNAIKYFESRLLGGIQLNITVDEAYRVRGPPIPIFASPIMMFHPETGKPYLPGEAPSIWSLIFPSLTSARWVDPDVDIYLITNFIVNRKDQAELTRLNIKTLDMDTCFSYGRVKKMYESFSQSCPIYGKDLGGSGIIGVTRFYALQGAMEMFGLDMVFFLEGDNLLLKSTEFLAAAYRIRENKIDATVTGVSFHTSFIGIEFLHQLNLQANEFGEYTKKSITKECFLTGGGQDMRLGYEGAKMLQIHRQNVLKDPTKHIDYGPNHIEMSQSDARILNTAGGTVPCELKARKWVNNIASTYCTTVKYGPCALEENLNIFHKNHKEEGWRNDDNETYLPLIYECLPSSIQHRTPTVNMKNIPGSIQINMKGAMVKSFNGFCKKKDSRLCEETSLDKVQISSSFYCRVEHVIKDKNSYNKAINFKNGRVFSQTPNQVWIEHYNLHFQGGGCKKQMDLVFTAIKRSTVFSEDGLSLSGFTCEMTASIDEHEECMRSGKGAVAALNNLY